MKSRLLSIAVSMATMLVLDAKKITKDFLEGEIADVKYQRLDGTLTHCTITTHDGFTFTGESACIDPAQFDEEIGQQIAYKQAFDKMYLPYGFWLHKTLKHQNQTEENKAKTTSNLAFGEAVESLKAGYKVARAGWNGKNMWLVHVANHEYQVCFADTPDFVINRSPFIAMKTADDKFVPWLASQTDVLAEDWVVVTA